MTLNETHRRNLIIHNIEKANAMQKEVNFLIENEYYSLAINRVYYGMFYIISALALKQNFTTSNHSQLLGWFNKKYVKENIIDRKFGKMIYKAFEQRMESDYNILHKFTLEDAKSGLQNLKKVTESISKLLK